MSELKLPLKAKMLDGMPIVVDADEKCVADMAFGGEQGMELARIFAVSVNSHAALVEACKWMASVCEANAYCVGQWTDEHRQVAADAANSGREALSLAEPEQS